MSPTIFRERGFRFFFFYQEETTGFRPCNWLKSEKSSRHMKLSSSTHGVSTSEVEVTHVSSHGIWLLADGCEHFLSYDDFPWFRDAPIGKVMNIEQVSAGHFRWSDLDIDLGIDAIENLEKFPLKAR